MDHCNLFLEEIILLKIILDVLICVWFLHNYCNSDDTYFTMNPRSFLYTFTKAKTFLCSVKKSNSCQRADTRKPAHIRHVQ